MEYLKDPQKFTALGGKLPKVFVICNGLYSLAFFCLALLWCDGPLTCILLRGLCVGWGTFDRDMRAFVCGAWCVKRANSLGVHSGLIRSCWSM